jgi:hypothetical protein
VKSITSLFRAGGSSFIVLAPAGAQVSNTFQRVEVDAHLREHFLAEMQRFRGGVYRNDGAILPGELTNDGRHYLPVDDNSWHVLTLRSDGTICACLRFLEQPARHFDKLLVRQAALMQSSVWAPKLKRAVEREMAIANGAGISFGEVGGWAISPDRRLTMEPLRTILATYGLLELLGSCSGIATATRRHGSAPILRRIGLSPIVVDGEELPAYYDPKYRCEMEVLRFDSRCPSPKFQSWVNELASLLTIAPVICNRDPWRSSALIPAMVPVASVPAPALVGLF